MSNEYFCCGVPQNPWDDIFGNGATQPVAQQGKSEQAWDNPFDLAAPATQTPQYRQDARSIGSSTLTYDRSVADTRSVGTRSYDSRDSNLTNKSLKDIEREEKARKRAMLLSETLMETGDLQKGMEKPKPLGLDRGVMGPAAAAMILEKKGLSKSPDEKTLVNKAAMSTKRKLWHLIKRTETTRPKKELTPEDVRDPDTVPGMKLQVDVEKEEKAKNQATLMISSGRYAHNEKAGTAFYTPFERESVNRTDRKVNAIC